MTARRDVREKSIWRYKFGIEYMMKTCLTWFEENIGCHKTYKNI